MLSGNAGMDGARALRGAVLPWILWLVLCGEAGAQIGAPARPQAHFDNSTSVGVSVGTQNERDADFWGFSIDYTRRVAMHWFTAVGLTWDRETQRHAQGGEVEKDTWNLLGTVSYGFTRWFALTTGLAKGFADNDNTDGSMQFTNGDWGTGLVAGFATPGLPGYARDSVNLSVAYEYNLSAKETSFSVDLNFGLSF